jgi:hypothetical protein
VATDQPRELHRHRPWYPQGAHLSEDASDMAPPGRIPSELHRIASPSTPAAAPKQERVSAERSAR